MNFKGNPVLGLANFPVLKKYYLNYSDKISYVVENGKKINSQKLKLPSGKKLKGEEREIFEVKKIKIDVLKSELIINLN